MMVMYAALILSVIGCLIALAIATAYVRDKPAGPLPVRSVSQSAGASGS